MSCALIGRSSLFLTQKVRTNTSHNFTIKLLWPEQVGLCGFYDITSTVHSKTALFWRCEVFYDLSVLFVLPLFYRIFDIALIFVSVQPQHEECPPVSIEFSDSDLLSSLIINSLFSMICEFKYISIVHYHTQRSFNVL